eukprot:m.120182 g.120182  ORF g.120182 m.120182 type:complete len:463 (+) comp28794_c0_seq1:128-1516(+)
MGFVHIIVCFATIFVLTFADVCNYTQHTGTTYLGDGHSNVIKCLDAEGAVHCQQRCDEDVHCAGYGVYLPINSGRCCTKFNNDGATTWSEGVSFTKISASPNCTIKPPPPPTPPPPTPPSAPVTHSTLFFGNATWPYSKQAMIQDLPGGKMVAAFQSASSEGAVDQRILMSVSLNGGASFGSFVAPIPARIGPQWQPIFHYDVPNSTLWMFYSEGPTSLFAVTSIDDAVTWSQPRLIFNASSLGWARVWPINRLAVQGSRWLLPCDYGCGGTTAAFALISLNNGQTWAPSETIPNATLGCPESAMVAINSTAVFALIRFNEIGLLQSWSSDGGQHWSVATDSGVNSATSKPALTSIIIPPSSTPTLYLAYNVLSRKTMALLKSLDLGETWSFHATLESGDELVSDCYPTVLTVNNSVLTSYTATVRENGTSNRCPAYSNNNNAAEDSNQGCFTNVRLASTTL